MENLLRELNEAWDDELGFLGKLRAGKFDREGAEAYIALLARIPPIEGDVVNSELVKLIWFAPMFIEWQIERVADGEREIAELNRIADRVQESVAGILGIP